MEVSTKERPIPNPIGEVGYQEKRAIRFAYCVMGWTPLKIADHMGRSYKFVANQVDRNGYKGLRKRLDAELIKNATKGMEADVESVVGLTTTALTRWLTQVVKDPAPLSAKDAKLISDIGANFHRILQLVKNKPTNISQTLPAMSDEIATEAFVKLITKMKEDPMFDMPKFLKETGVTKEDFEGHGLDLSVFN